MITEMLGKMVGIWFIGQFWLTVAAVAAWTVWSLKSLFINKERSVQ